MKVNQLVEAVEQLRNDALRLTLNATAAQQQTATAQVQAYTKVLALLTVAQTREYSVTAALDAADGVSRSAVRRERQGLEVVVDGYAFELLTVALAAVPK